MDKKFPITVLILWVIIVIEVHGILQQSVDTWYAFKYYIKHNEFVMIMFNGKKGPRRNEKTSVKFFRVNPDLWMKNCPLTANNQSQL